MPPNDQFNAAISRFDDANRQDPHHTVVDGKEYPSELLYSIRMTDWLKRLQPDASEPLRLAARAQHICRWMISRINYPMDRAGYHRWRDDLASFHAETAGKILREVGYDDATIARVKSLLRKEHLKDDREMQCLEDVICLVFLQYEFSDFASKHEDEKVIHILRRTWRKMSTRGHEAALKIGFSERDRKLIEQAISAI